jgi:uncharacterized protein
VTTSVENGVSGLVRRRPVISLFVLSYVGTWLIWAPLVVAQDSMPGALGFVLALLGSLVPSSVAIVLVARLHGKAGLRKFLARLTKFRVGVRWYAALLLLPMLVPLGVGLSVVFGGSKPSLDTTVLGALMLFAFQIFPGSAMGEELGWRGFALPYLQREHSALGVSLFIGALWSLWHFPLYLVGTDIRPLSIFPAFVLAVIATSVICSWLYNSTGGSLLIIVLFHAASNLPITLLIAPYGEQSARPFLFYLALLVVAAGVIAVATDPANLSRTKPKQVDVP